MDSAEMKRLRIELGLTVADLATKMRVSPRTVRRWEDGTRTVPGPAQVIIALLIGDSEEGR
jgi:DNA-binding transcriptional regulator YiaG